MGHPRRFYRHNRAYFVTNRLAEGLPFVANVYINTVLAGILAKAKLLFPSIAICAWLFMENHYHAFLVTKGDPQLLARFMHYVDGELAKVLCRWLGKSNTKIWSQRYHASELLTVEAAMKELTYLYLNPIAVDLEECIDKYPGLNTWLDVLGGPSRICRYVRPKNVRKLPNGKFTKTSIRELMAGLEKLKRPEIPLIIEPFAWKNCFELTQGLSDDELRKCLIERVREGEKKYALERQRRKRGVVGAAALGEHNPHRHYKPESRGKRVWCICEDPELRKAFIELYRAFCRACTSAWQRWCRGDYAAKYPPGAFLPPQPPRANVVNVEIFAT